MYNDYSYAREMMRNGNYRKCYDALNSFSDRDAEWYYLRGVSAMELGYYEEGEDYLKRAKFMDPENMEYENTYNRYMSRKNSYNQNAGYYNTQRNNMDNMSYGGCCPCPCCCIPGNLCDTCCTLWCCDSCCECSGGDLITCC